MQIQPAVTSHPPSVVHESRAGSPYTDTRIIGLTPPCILTFRYAAVQDLPSRTTDREFVRWTHLLERDSPNVSVKMPGKERFAG